MKFAMDILNISNAILKTRIDKPDLRIYVFCILVHFWRAYVGCNKHVQYINAILKVC